MPRSPACAQPSSAQRRGDESAPDTLIGVDPDIVVAPAAPSDAGEIWTLQRAAFLVEAFLYNELDLPPLQEGLDGVRAAIDGPGIVLVARLGHRIVGAGRAIPQDGYWEIGRMAVAPDLWGHGIGGAVLAGLEARLPTSAPALELWTAHASTGQWLYRKHGFTEIRTERVAEQITLLRFRKELTSGTRTG